MKRDTYSSIIKASGIEKGDLVLVQYWMGDNFCDDVAYLQAEIAAVGASPMLVVHKISMSQMINENITDTTYGDKFFALYEKADVVIDLLERPVGVLNKPLEPEKMGLLGAYMQRLFQTCVGKKKMLQLRVPTKAMADSFDMEEKDFADRLEAAMNIDYEKLYDDCVKLKEEYKGKQSATILTGDGKYELSLSFATREWSIDAGDGDIPCGEIAIAPIENQTNGQVYFREAYIPNPEKRGKLEKFEDLLLTITNGSISATSQKEADKLLENLGKENAVVCELGIGMNPGVTSLCGCPLLDEKMIGTFHLGFGDNTMFGGRNEADEHYDLVAYGKVIIE